MNITTKRFLQGMFAGYVIKSIHVAYQDGVYHRAAHVFGYMKAGGHEAPLSDVFNYLASGQPSPYFAKVRFTEMAPGDQLPEGDENDITVWYEYAKRIRAMHTEGYSEEEIAESTGIDPMTIGAVLFASEDKFYRVTFNGAQHEVVLLALQQLSPDDEESETVIETAIQALIDTTERIEP
jgi:hypothetical protein